MQERGVLRVRRAVSGKRDPLSDALAESALYFAIWQIPVAMHILRLFLATLTPINSEDSAGKQLTEASLKLPRKMFYLEHRAIRARTAPRETGAAA